MPPRPGRSAGVRPLGGIVLAAGLLLLFAAEARDVLAYSARLLARAAAPHPGTAFGDLDYFREAALRFFQDPARLYDRESMLAFRGFIYPPIAVLFVLPFAAMAPGPGFVLFGAAALAAGLGGGLLFGRAAFRGGRAWLFMLLVAASGPFYANFVAVQFNLLVLFACAVAVSASGAGRHWLAGLALALACWMKIYPGFLLLAMLALPARRPTAWRAIGIGVALPLLLLPVLPLAVYREFLDVAHSLSAQYLANIDNGSVAAALGRLGLPRETWAEYRILPIPGADKLAGYAVGAAVLALCAWRARRAEAAQPVMLAALAATPLVTPQGWTHAFVFAMPLLAFLVLRPGPVVPRLAGGLAWLALLMPGYHVFAALDPMPLPLAAAVYGRAPLAVGAAILVALLWPVPART